MVPGNGDHDFKIWLGLLPNNIQRSLVMRYEIGYILCNMQHGLVNFPDDLEIISMTRLETKLDYGSIIQNEVSKKLDSDFKYVNKTMVIVDHSDCNTYIAMVYYADHSVYIYELAEKGSLRCFIFECSGVEQINAFANAFTLQEAEKMIRCSVARVIRTQPQVMQIRLLDIANPTANYGVVEVGSSVN